MTAKIKITQFQFHLVLVSLDIDSPFKQIASVVTAVEVVERAFIHHIMSHLIIGVTTKLV